MQRNSNIRILPLIISIIVIALVIAAVVSIGRAIFGGPSSDETAQVDQGREALLNTTGGRSVQMTVRGPIVADENFQSYQVEVSNSERSITAYKGYLESRTNGTSLSNNTRAYEQFVNALDKANMMKGKEPETEDSLLGICASGYVYEYAVLSSANPVKTLWTSTCSGSKGTLNASRQQLTNLFLGQIPNSNDYIPFQQSFDYSL
jgi:hypothetical protein